MVEEEALSPLALRRRKLQRLRQDKCRRQKHREDSQMGAEVSAKHEKHNQLHHHTPSSPSMETTAASRMSSHPKKEISSSGGSTMQFKGPVKSPSVSDRAKKIDTSPSAISNARFQQQQTRCEQDHHQDLHGERLLVDDVRQEGNSVRRVDAHDHSKRAEAISTRSHYTGSSHSGKMDSPTLFVSVPKSVEDDASSILTASSASRADEHYENDTNHQGYETHGNRKSNQNTNTQPNTVRNANLIPNGKNNNDFNAGNRNHPRRQNDERDNRDEGEAGAGDEDDRYACSVVEFSKYFDKGGEAFVEPPVSKGPSKFVADRARVFDPPPKHGGPRRKQRDNNPVWGAQKKKTGPTGAQKKRSPPPKNVKKEIDSSTTLSAPAISPYKSGYLPGAGVAALPRRPEVHVGVRQQYVSAATSWGIASSDSNDYGRSSSNLSASGENRRSSEAAMETQELRHEIAQLQEELQSAVDYESLEVQELQEEVSRLRKELGNARNSDSLKVQQLKNEIADLKKVVRRATNVDSAEVQELQGEISTLKEELNRTARTTKELKNENDSLREQLQRASSRDDSNQVQRLRKENQDLKHEIQAREEKMKQDTKRSMSVLASALKEIDVLRGQTESLNREMSELKNSRKQGGSYEDEKHDAGDQAASESASKASPKEDVQSDNTKRATQNHRTTLLRGWAPRE